MESVNKTSNMLAILGYLVLSLCITFPVMLSPINTVVGHPEASVGCHIWVIWWAQNFLGDFHTPLLFYPYGADVIQLYGSDLFSPLLFSFLPFPPSLLYNIWVHVLLIIGAMGVRALLHNTSTVGAFTGGCIFMTAPFFQHELFNGTSELLSSGLLPWYVLFLLRLLDTPTTKTGIYLGMVAGVLLTSSVYNPFFMLILSIVIIAHKSTHQLAPLFTKNPLFTKELTKSSLLSVCIFLPFFLLTGLLHLYHGASETLSRRINWLDQGLALPDSYVGLLDWVDPSSNLLPYPIDLPDGSTFSYWTTCTCYLGLVSLLAGILGWKQIKNTPIAFSSWLLVVSILIAMGPYLRLNNEILYIQEIPIYLPASTIGYLFPLFSVTAIHAYRYTSLVCLALSLLAGKAIRSWWWLPCILVDVFLLSPHPPMETTTIPQSETLEYLAQADDGAVFTFPIAQDNLHDLSVLLLTQTIHHKPIHDGGMHTRAGVDATQLFMENYIVANLSHPWKVEYPSIVETQIAFQILHKQGYKYILCPENNPTAIAFAYDIWGKPTKKDDSWAVWTLE